MTKKLRKVWMLFIYGDNDEFLHYVADSEKKCQAELAKYCRDRWPFDEEPPKDDVKCTEKYFADPDIEGVECPNIECHDVH